MSECKYQLLEDLVSYDDGGLWESQNPPVYLKGNLIEPDSPDCDGYDGYLERWIPVDGGYICEGNNKYIKEILQISNDGGVTWYPSNPLASRTGEFVKVDEEFCSYLFEGQYVYSGDSSGGGGGGCTSQPCPSGYYWYSARCTCVQAGGDKWENRRLRDPLKIIKCNNKTEITSGDTLYYNPNNWYLQSAKIGGCAVSIGDGAFSSANRTKTVSSITFTDATNLTSIGNNAFKGCSALSSVTIPDSVTSIGVGAFNGCSSLASINIPSGVRVIENGLFQNCTSLSSITIPNGVTMLGSGGLSDGSSFADCTSLREITIPNSVVIIGASSFAGCTSLSSCTIGSGVTSSTGGLYNYIYGIGHSAFNGCTALTGITINATTPPSLGTGAFDNTNDCPIFVPCESVIAYRSAWSKYASRIQGIPPCVEPAKFSATYSGGQTYSAVCDSSSVLETGTTKPSGYTASAMTSAVIGSCVTSIGDYAFGGFSENDTCTSLSSITIPDSVTVIGESAFHLCSGLTSVAIPDSVTSISGSAFVNCYSLTSCTIGSGVKSIGYNAFYNCHSLTSIDIPSGVTYVGYAFSDCTALTAITVNATTPPEAHYNGLGGGITCPIYVPCESVDAYKAASGWSKNASRIQGIPPCETPVGKLRATYSGGGIYNLDCDGITTLSQGNTRPSGYQASAMTSAIVGDCVTKIGDSAFTGKTNLSSVTLSDTVTSIGQYAFTGCSSLISLDIPSGVTYIDYFAFRHCSGLTSITCLATTPPSLGSWAFDDTNNCPIYVPCESVSAYQTAWSDYASRIQAIPGSCTKFSATYSGGQTYSAACDSGTTLTTGTTKPSGYECTAMTSAVVGSCVTSIGRLAFSYCASLSSVTIPENSQLTSIGNSAFQGCTALSSITIPDSVTSIDTQAFLRCTSLTSITVNATTPPTLGSNVFYNTNDCPIYVPAASVDTYKTANRWSDYADRIRAIP